MDYQLKDGETEAKQLNPATSSAEQLAAWCGGVVGRGGMADAYLTLPDGTVAHTGDWVVRKADGSVSVQPAAEPLEGYPSPEPQPAPTPEPQADPPAGRTYYGPERR